MTVAEAVKRDVDRLPNGLSESGLAAVALSLADSLDDPGMRGSARAMVAKELRETMGVLRSLAPEVPQADDIDELTRRRDRRRAAP